MCFYLVWSKELDCALDAVCAGELAAGAAQCKQGLIGGIRMHGPMQSTPEHLQNIILLISGVNACKSFCKSGKGMRFFANIVFCIELVLVLHIFYQSVNNILPMGNQH